MDQDVDLYNLINDPDEINNAYLDPEFRCLTDDLYNLTKD